MRKLIALLLAVIFSFSMVACGSSEPSNNEEDNIPKITMPYDESHYTGTDRPYYLVAKELEELGFTNITLTEVEDGFFYYSVENVKIFENEKDKKGDFEEGDIFPENALVEIEYYGDIMADGIIKDTDIFEIEEKLKNIEGYNWSEDHGVIEGKTGYFGTCLCEEQDIWCDLYSDDNYEVESVSIDVYEEDLELLITFASFFDTELIDVEAVQQWIREYDNNDSASQIFGDAEFTMFYGLHNDEKYTLSIRALE